jgi:hypothetical protein
MKHKRKQKNIVLSAGISAQEEKAEGSGLKRMLASAHPVLGAKKKVDRGRGAATCW